MINFKRWIYNGAIGNIYVYECKNYVVYVEDTNKVVFQGLDGYIASEKNGYILICQRSEEQRIKEYKGYDRVVRRT